MLKRILIVLLGLSLGFSISVAHSEEKQVIRIGVILPLTGGMAHVGAAFRDAARLAIEELPSDTRFNYELIFEDDALSAGKVALAANKLLRVDHVDAMISTWSYGGAVVAPMAEQSKTIHFGVAWDPVVAKGEYNFLHLTPPREFISKILDGFAKLHYKRIASFGVTESGSLFALDELDRLSKERGMEVIDRTIFQFSDLDMHSALLKTAEHKPDVIYVNLAAPQIDLFIKQLGELKIETPVVAMTGYDVATDLTPLEGRWYVSDSFVSNDLVERFVKRYHHTDLYGVGNYYDLVKLVVYLFEHSPKGNKPTSDQMLAITKDLSGFESIFGRLSVDSEGIITYPAQYMKIDGGKRVPITLNDIH